MHCPTPTNKLAYVGGYDGAGNSKTLLPRAGGVLYNAQGQVAAQWSDGSNDFPIRTPDMLKQSNAAETVMVQDPSGRWYRLAPPSTVDKQWLVTQAGAVRFENIINERLTRFPAGVLDDPACDFNVAVFTQCEGGNIAKIGRVSAQDLADKLKPLLIEEEEETSITEGTCLTNITGFNGAVQQTLKAEANKMIVACAGDGTNAPCWKAVDAGLMFYPLAQVTPIFQRPAGGGGGSSQNVLLPNFPQKICPSRGIFAQLSCSLASNASSFTVQMHLNNVAVLGLQGDSQGNNTTAMIPIQDNGILTVNLVVLGGSAFGWGGTVELWGYWR